MQSCPNLCIRATVVHIIKCDIPVDVSTPDTAHLINEEKEEKNVQRNGFNDHLSVMPAFGTLLF